MILLVKCFRYWHVLNNDENFMHKVRNEVRTTRLQNFKTQSCLFRFYLTCKQQYCHTARRRGARNLINFIRIDNLLLDRDWLISSSDDNSAGLPFRNWPKTNLLYCKYLLFCLRFTANMQAQQPATCYSPLCCNTYLDSNQVKP